MNRNSVVGLCLAGCLACSHDYLPAASLSAPPLPENGTQLFVGTSRGDVTPPPGVALFNGAPHASNGIWTRLYCRAFVLREGPGILAVVPCDLPAISALLQRRVVVHLAESGVPIPASRLMLLATGTKAGPAHYLEGKASAGRGSSDIPGFDPAMVEFIASRVAAAVKDAFEHLREGEVRWSRDTEANQELSVLEVRVKAPAGPCPAGWLTFTAMPPLGNPKDNRWLGGDASGAASRGLEAHLRAQLEACQVPADLPLIDPVAGFVNTTNTERPASLSWSIDDAMTLGQDLATRTRRAVSRNRAGMYVSKPVLGIRYVESAFRDTQLKTGTTAYPTILPTAVVRIDDSVIALVPALPGKDDGARIRQSLEAAVGGRLHPIVGGLANAYNPHVSGDPWLAMVAGALARRLDDPAWKLPGQLDRVHATEYVTGPSRRRLPDGSNEATLEALADQRRPITLCSVSSPAPAAVCFFWTDGAPGVALSTQSRWTALVQASSPASFAQLPDDRGVEFRTRVHRPDHDAWIWSTAFRPSAPDGWKTYESLGPLALRAAADSPKLAVDSQAFAAAVLPRACTVREKDLCGL